MAQKAPKAGKPKTVSTGRRLNQNSGVPRMKTLGKKTKR